MHVLFLSANPDPASQLAVDREYRRLFVGNSSRAASERDLGWRTAEGLAAFRAYRSDVDGSWCVAPGDILGIHAGSEVALGS
jgi:hypothetical protein